MLSPPKTSSRSESSALEGRATWTGAFFLRRTTVLGLCRFSSSDSSSSLSSLDCDAEESKPFSGFDRPVASALALASPWSPDSSLRPSHRSKSVSSSFILWRRDFMTNEESKLSSVRLESLMKLEAADSFSGSILGCPRGVLAAFRTVRDICFSWRENRTIPML